MNQSLWDLKHFSQKKICLWYDHHEPIPMGFETHRHTALYSNEVHHEPIPMGFETRLLI